MIERGGRLRLALETGHELGIGRQRRQQRLEGDVTLQRLVQGAVDDAHPAGADHLLDPVGAEALGMIRGHRRFPPGAA